MPAPKGRRIIRMLTEAGAIDVLARRGFTENLSVVADHLRNVETGEKFRSRDVVVREYRRFEGVSDPDDTAIVYAIETRSGTRGTVIDAYGVYADPAVSAFMASVPIERKP
jgi:hypothetical protein